MKTRLYCPQSIPAVELGKIRDYLNQTVSQSLGDAWCHKIWSYDLYYPNGIVPCKNYDEVKRAVKDRGETSKHLTYFESAKGRKLKVDTTSKGFIAVSVENGKLTDAVFARVESMLTLRPLPRRVFVTHGHGHVWREVADFVEKECNPSLEFIELASRASKGRTIIEKLDEESVQCSFAIVVMTGDDIAEDEVRARENVIHEIGFFQGRYGRGRVCLMHEDQVHVPSNLSGVVYCGFPKSRVAAAFIELQRELKAAFPE